MCIHVFVVVVVVRSLFFLFVSPMAVAHPHQCCAFLHSYRSESHQRLEKRGESMSKLEQRKLGKTPRKPQRSRARNPKEAERAFKIQQRKKERLQRVRELSTKLRDEINNEEKRARESRKANLDRKAENEKKNMVVQKIKNDKAIRKLSPKHRKKARIYMMHEL
ncbi:hypothetical protein, conserved [Trypanosoma brucei gambiense DAL972]|nr:hypothetical protein, conserved [Trypanosoma brucei gambiense DAL972]CBH14501.1 hypothetical protein, conserved [Trypanosoma brucei gambiense DAL972]|eukprot:XP_011776767.1 hypothetical protein, conserved [Trypanosoma brucei gambiense DAL972]